MLVRIIVHLLNLARFIGFLRYRESTLLAVPILADSQAVVFLKGLLLPF